MLARSTSIPNTAGPTTKLSRSFITGNLAAAGPAPSFKVEGARRLFVPCLSFSFLSALTGTNSSSQAYWTISQKGKFAGKILKKQRRRPRSSRSLTDLKKKFFVSVGWCYDKWKDSRSEPTAASSSTF